MLLEALVMSAALATGARTGPPPVVTPQLTTLAELHAWWVPDRCAGTRSAPTVLLLHGYGTSRRRLRQLARSRAALQCVRLILRHGPLHGRRGGRVWWRAPREGWRPIPEGWAAVAPGMEGAWRQVTDILAAIEQRWQVSASTIILAGFSQSATLAVDVAMRADLRVGALVFLSGRFGANAVWQSDSGPFCGAPIVVAHGRADRVAPYWPASELRELLQGAGARVSWFAYDGGHHPSPSVSRRFHDTLEAALQRVASTGAGLPPSATSVTERCSVHGPAPAQG